MSNISIFKQNVPASARAGEVSELTKALAGNMGGGTSRRISTRGSVFRKVVNGEEVGKLKDREMNVIIVNALPKVSRQFYAKAYDPQAEATLPDCWSNLGDVPDPKAKSPQANSCATCPQNVAGTGQNGSRACKFQRRVALVLEGDMNGDVYQMNFASKSLFGKGEGNVHPFESYTKFLTANNESIDRIVTQISFDTNEDSPVLKFSPVRHLTDEEIDVVIDAAGSYEAKNAIQLTVAAQDKANKLQLPKAEPKAAQFTEVVEVEEVVEEPVKRASKKAEVPPAAPKAALSDVISAWSDN
jgi:hypothetical protein